MMRRIFWHPCRFYSPKGSCDMASQNRSRNSGTPCICDPEFRPKIKIKLKILEFHLFVEDLEVPLLVAEHLFVQLWVLPVAVGHGAERVVERAV
jgi:hypothetical protein